MRRVLCGSAISHARQTLRFDQPPERLGGVSLDPLVLFSIYALLSAFEDREPWRGRFAQ